MVSITLNPPPLHQLRIYTWGVPNYQLFAKKKTMISEMEIFEYHMSASDSCDDVTTHSLRGMERGLRRASCSFVSGLQSLKVKVFFDL